MMAGFDHANTTSSPEDDVGAGRRSRIGLVLFAVYFLFYAAFMGLSAFFPATMRSTPFGGVTLAVSYGFGLIVAALALALLYAWLCRVVSASGAATPLEKGRP
jgi:uncharacterized membrane protein (DUF485 family)